VRVVNMLGRVVWSGKVVNQEKINVTKWGTGTYIVQVGSYSQVIVIK
jgi:hypothetical protein